MKAALVHAVDRVELVELPVPEIGSGEILVRMKAVGLCGSDITPWYVATKAPAVLGHETAGVVERVADDVYELERGDRVFVHHHAPCGSCRRCVNGDAVMCESWKPTRLHPGGLAELVRVEAGAVAADTLRIPDRIGLDDGALVEPVACGVKAVDRARVVRGDTVFVVGLGSNGILLALLARHAGAGRLVGCDPDPARRRIAERFGFDALVASAPEAGRWFADAVFVIPTAEEAVLAGIAAAGPGGRVVLYSPIAPEKVWRVPPHEAYLRDLSLTFSYSCGPGETRRALDLIASGVVRAERLVTHRLPLARVQEGFRLAAGGGDVLKVLIEL